VSATEFPTLELGELGAALEEAVRDDESIVAEGEVEGTAAGEREAGAGESAAEPAPAAEAGAEAEPDAEDAYKARFEADYAARSREDIRAVQSSLDKQIAQWRSRHTEAAKDLEEASDYVAFLEKQLGEYDPEEVARFRRNRQGYREKQQAKVRDERADFARRADYRAIKFKQLYPDLDPEDPELFAAFREGNQALEATLIRAKLAETKLHRTVAAPTPEASAKADSEPKAEAPRDESGRFVSRGDVTRRVEQARGATTLGALRGAPQADKPATTLEEARAHMAKGFADLGIPLSPR
jgi:hypothetical protein